MDAFTIASERARMRRRIIILDDSGHIVRIQAGSALDDRIFGFSAMAAALPDALSELVHRALNTGTFAANDRIGAHVFPLEENDARHIGVILELLRHRTET
jgi:hypothetical protein